MHFVELGLVIALFVLFFHGWLISRLNRRLFELLFVVRELPLQGFLRDGVVHPMADGVQFGDVLLVERLNITEFLAERNIPYLAKFL